MMFVMKIGTVRALAVPPTVSCACPRPPSGFAVSSGYARDVDWHGLGFGCAPPRQKRLGLASGPLPDSQCLLMTLAMWIGMGGIAGYGENRRLFGR